MSGRCQVWCILLTPPPYVLIILYPIRTSVILQHIFVRNRVHNKNIYLVKLRGLNNCKRKQVLSANQPEVISLWEAPEDVHRRHPPRS